METLIEPHDYTPQILGLIDVLNHRMSDTLIEFTDDQIQVFDVDGTIYILANPRLGEERIIDDNGLVKLVPLHNMTIMYDENWVSSGGWNEKGDPEMKIKTPGLRVLRPDLCIRIRAGEVVEGSL